MWDKTASCPSQCVGVRTGESPGTAVQVSAPRDLCDRGHPEHGEQAEQYHHDPEEDSGQWSVLLQDVHQSLVYFSSIASLLTVCISIFYPSCSRFPLCSLWERLIVLMQVAAEKCVINLDFWRFSLKLFQVFILCFQCRPLWIKSRQQ